MIESGAFHVARFTCFACPCELHLPTSDPVIAEEVSHDVAIEAWRIQEKYSRFDKASWLSQLNKSSGSKIDVDEETAGLLEFAQSAYQLSKGAFDVTAGILQRAWSFTPGSKPPEDSELRRLLEMVGWHRVSWEKNAGRIQLKPEMELDLGGIGKEYAVDQGARILGEYGFKQTLTSLRVLATKIF